MTIFSHATATVSIAFPPARPFSAPISLAQQDALDSSGNRYVYYRAGTVDRPVSLTFPRVTAAELAALNSFVVAEILGNRHTFTWTDSAGSPHAVRYVSHDWLQVAPDRYRINLTLNETLSSVWDASLWGNFLWA